MTDSLSAEQKREYDEDGYTVLRSVFSHEECQALVDRMLDLHAGREKLDGFAAREADDWKRTHNQHLYDPTAMDWLLHPRLREPLADCLEDEPEGIQTMYFYKGSEQRRHQDRYYLPACMSAWLPMIDVGPDNGTIWVQPGSHKRHLVTIEELQARNPGEHFDAFDEQYNDAVDEQYERNRAEGLGDDIPVPANAGDVVLFHGTLIHRGGPIGQPGSYRHVMANHYIPYGFKDWPYAHWPRIAFTGERRTTSPG